MCGVIGAINVPNAYNAIVSMMDALQYRGENGAGMALATYDGDFFWERTEFTVPDLVHKTSHRGLAKNNQGYFSGVGHDRYGTTGDKRSLDNAQPLMSKMSWGDVYLAHNGDSPYVEEDRQALIQRGLPFSTTSDSELILNQMLLSGSDDSLNSIKNGLRAYRGTYALTMLIRDKDGIKLIVARDPSGNRPLALGRLGGGYVVASENSAFEVINAVYERDILPGELLVISQNSLFSHPIYDHEDVLPLKQCIYELEYFSLPTSETFGISVSQFRKELGNTLAKEFGHLITPDDIITNVPDSSNTFAEGFCQAIHRELTTTILRRHSTKSFTQESQAVIEDTLRRKFSFLQSGIKDILKQNPNTRFWIIEDSIVRGNTGRKIIRVFRGLGVRWVGVLSGVPPLIGPCKKGIDMEGKDGSKLIAAQHILHGIVCDPRAVAAEVEANFVGYQSLQGVYDAVRSFGKDPDNFCHGCFENREPIWGKW